MFLPDRLVVSKAALREHRRKLVSMKSSADLLTKQGESLRMMLHNLNKKIDTATSDVVEKYRKTQLSMAVVSWQSTISNLESLSLDVQESSIISFTIKDISVWGVRHRDMVMHVGEYKETTHATSVIDFLKAAVELSNLYRLIDALRAEIKTVNRRVSAFENILIPKVTASVAFIATELDEQDREALVPLRIMKKHKTLAEPQITNAPTKSKILFN